jgi:hypothetical protein
MSKRAAEVQSRPWRDRRSAIGGAPNGYMYSPPETLITSPLT